jgi:hypothetical protein
MLSNLKFVLRLIVFILCGAGLLLFVMGFFSTTPIIAAFALSIYLAIKLVEHAEKNNETKDN